MITSAAMVPNTRISMFDPNIVNTFFGTAAAVLAGFITLRKLEAFPGTRAIGYAIPVLTTSFMIIFSIFLLVRLEYGRIQFISSFLFSCVWFVLILSLAQRYSHRTLAILPFGDAPSLAGLHGVRWKTLTNSSVVPRDVDAVVADLSADLPSHWQLFLTETALSGVPVFNVKPVREVLTGRVEIQHLSENTLGSLNPNDGYLKLKALFDFLLAITALTLLWPIMVGIGLAVKADSPGPALFRQKRTGLRGRVFTVYKFRTMVVSAPLSEPRDYSKTHAEDARITRVGRFLRRSRLDELPQILNILKGEMSWIGPRPEAVPLARWYEAELPFYRYRHILRPGITGWAQVNQGHVTEIDEVLEKLHYDFFYIKNFSAWLDILIFLKTIKVIVTGFGAR
ncbi:MAG: sugar transferase [Pseudomonadota bacterium]